MRVIAITVCLFLGAAIAEDAGIEEAINPAEDVGIGLLNKADQSYESPKLKKLITHCTSHVGETCSTTTSTSSSSSGSEALMQNEGVLALCLFDSMERCLVDNGAQLYHTSVTNHHARTLGVGIPFVFVPRPPQPPVIMPIPILHNHQVQPLAQRIRLPPMRPLPPLPVRGPTSPIQRPIPTIPSPPIAPEDLSLLIETIELRTVLRTCTHVTAQTCLTAPNVATSDLEACLAPSMNQCVYPPRAESGSPSRFKSPIRA